MARALILNIKNLKISGPNVVVRTTLKLKCNVIVVAKFDFVAETAEELLVKKGDVLKLLDRLPNGWVLVKFIDKMEKPGLVPSLYVDIAVNDPQNPITVQWLHQSATGSGTSFIDAEVQSLLDRNAPQTFNNRAYPLTVVVSHYLTFENRFWYRVDVKYSTGEQGYLCRYYQDFYDLHAAMLSEAASDTHQPSTGKLPKLPEPVPSTNRNSTELEEIFSRRCGQLSTYMSELIHDKGRQVAAMTIDWLECSYQGRPGFVVPEIPNDTQELISQRVLPGSVTLASECRLRRVKSTSREPKTEHSKYMVPPGSELQRAKSKNIYNHYQQAASFSKLPARSASTRSPGRSLSQRRPSTDATVLRLKTMTNPVKSKVAPVFRPSDAPPTPKLPFDCISSPLLSSGFKSPEVSIASPASSTGSLHIKCKIKTQSNDILVIKLAKEQISTLDGFKTLIYNKVAFNNLFIKFPHSDSFQEIESSDVDALSFLHTSDCVLLLVT